MSFSFDNISLNNFSLSESNVLSAVRGGGVLGLINSVLAPSFGIYYARNDPAGAHQKGGKPFSRILLLSLRWARRLLFPPSPWSRGLYHL
ncbi:Uncharacterised protein [Escherichia coli]|nr:Uncharacterised protein [Escherichia coli]